MALLYLQGLREGFLPVGLAAPENQRGHQLESKVNWTLAEQYYVGEDDGLEVANEASDHEVQGKMKTMALFQHNLSKLSSGAGAANDEE